MNNTENWIKWWRKSEDCEALWDDKMDKTHAFMYMVMSANIKQGKTAYGEIIKRGQFKTSIRKLSVAFGWGIEKTMAFLKELEKCNMIRTEKSRRGTLVTIVKYGTYQDKPNTKPNTKQNTDKNTKPNANPTLSKKNEEDEKEAHLSASKDASSVTKTKYDLSIPEVETW